MRHLREQASACTRAEIKPQRPAKKKRLRASATRRFSVLRILRDGGALWYNYREVVMRAYTNVDAAAQRFPIAEQDMEFCRSIEQNGGLPFLLTEHMASLLETLFKRKSDAFDAMYRQCIPTKAEETVLSCELQDPLGAHLYQVCPRLIHQYRSRCLLLTTARCFSYCRHCFRRSYTAQREGFITDAELAPVCEYLAAHEEVQEILCSGGDPLTAGDDALERLFTALRRARPGVLLRVCTRAPVFFPERITPRLAALFKAFRPLWVIPHVNHPAEIDADVSAGSVRAFSLLLDAGIPMQSQTVLLRGVNDSAQTLASLFQRLTELGIKPGYLFQGDLARGTSHLRVPPRQGLALYAELRALLSGLSCPVYAVDLPGGGGKCNMLQLDSAAFSPKVYREPQGYRFVSEAGSWFYPY